MKRNLIKIATLIAVFAVVLSINAFAAVGDSVANVFLNKTIVDTTADYYDLDDHVTYTDWADSEGYGKILGPECAVDGRYDDWGDFSRCVLKPGPGVLEIDLNGYFSLETLDVYHVWANVYGDSECDWFTAQVSVDGGKNWTTVIDKVALDHDTAIVTLDSSLEMGIVKSTLNMNGAVANKVRFIFDDDQAADNGFNIQELQCNGKEVEQPEIPETPEAPETFDGLSVAVAVMALGACGVVVAKKRR
jgi:hypothetical protein